METAIEIHTVECSEPGCATKVICATNHPNPRCTPHQSPEAREKNARLFREALACTTCGGDGWEGDCPGCGSP